MDKQRENTNLLWAKPCNNSDCAFCQDGYCLSSRKNVVTPSQDHNSEDVFCNGFVRSGSYMYQKKMLNDVLKNEGIFYVSDHNIDGRKPPSSRAKYYPVRIKKSFRFHATCEVCDKNGKGTNHFCSVSITNLVNDALAHRRLNVV